MLCPFGNVKTSDQPLVAVVPVLVMVMSSVRPEFQALTAALTRHAAVPGGGLLGLLGLDDGLLGLDDGPLGLDDGPPGSCVKKFHTTPEVQVCQPSQVHPSRGPGSWPAPSNAAQTTG